MNTNERNELVRLLDEQRSLVVDKKAIEAQLVEEPTAQRGLEWELRAKAAVSRIDKRLSAIKHRMVQIDPSGVARGALGKRVIAKVLLDVRSAFDAVRVLNELVANDERVIGFQVVDGKMVVLSETRLEKP